MSSGYSDRGIVVAHDLSEKLCPGEHWDSFFLCTGKFRVVRMDCCCIDNDINRILNVGSTLSIVESCTLAFKKGGQRAFFRVGTGDGKALLQENFGQSAHADSANTNKMDGDWFVKVYLIHNKNLLIFAEELLLIFKYYTSCR